MRARDERTDEIRKHLIADLRAAAKIASRRRSVGMAAPRIRIGISGWRYPRWRGSFYPKGLPQRSELGYASRILPGIEINGSFYSLQSPASYALWYEQTPPDFVFAVKGPRYGAPASRSAPIARCAMPSKSATNPSSTRRPRDVYCFFDNTDVKLRAPFDAQSLAKKLGVQGNVLSSAP